MMTRQSKDIAAVNKLAEDWTTGWNRGDPEALLSLFTEDPILIPQGQPAVRGKNALRSLYRSFFREFTVRGKGRVVKAEVSGDLGYFLSRYTLTATSKTEGNQMKGEGRSVFIVKRQEGDSWRIALLMDSSSRD